MTKVRASRETYAVCADGCGTPSLSPSFSLSASQTSGNITRAIPRLSASLGAGLDDGGAGRRGKEESGGLGRAIECSTSPLLQDGFCSSVLWGRITEAEYNSLAACALGGGLDGCGEVTEGAFAGGVADVGAEGAGKSGDAGVEARGSKEEGGVTDGVTDVMDEDDYRRAHAALDLCKMVRLAPFAFFFSTCLVSSLPFSPPHSPLSLIPFLSLSLSLARAHSHAHTHSLSLTHTHTLARSRARSRATLPYVSSPRPNMISKHCQTRPELINMCRRLRPAQIFSQKSPT